MFSHALQRNLFYFVTVLLRTWNYSDDRLITSSSLTVKPMLVFWGRCYSAEGVFSWCFHPGKCFEECLRVFITVYITIAKCNLGCFLHQLCSVIRPAQRGYGLTNCNSSNCFRIQNKERIFRLTHFVFIFDSAVAVLDQQVEYLVNMICRMRKSEKFLYQIKIRITSCCFVTKLKHK